MKKVNRYRAAWAAWVMAGLAIESAALLDSGSGGTLTEQIRPLLALHPGVWILGTASLIWAFKHLFLDGRKGE